MAGLVTVNETALLDTSLTVTVTVKDPAASPEGTVAVIEFPPLAQFVTVATTVPNFTLLEPCVDPKPLPLIVTDEPGAPDVGDKLVMLGAANIAVVANKTPKSVMEREKLRRIHVLRDLLSKRQLFGFTRGSLSADVSETLGQGRNQRV